VKSIRKNHDSLRKLNEHFILQSMEPAEKTPPSPTRYTERVLSRSQ